MEIRQLLMQLHEKRDLSTCLKSSALDKKYQGKNTAFFLMWQYCAASLTLFTAKLKCYALIHTIA